MDYNQNGNPSNNAPTPEQKRRIKIVGGFFILCLVVGLIALAFQFDFSGDSSPPPLPSSFVNPNLASSTLGSNPASFTLGSVSVQAAESPEPEIAEDGRYYVNAYLHEVTIGGDTLIALMVRSETFWRPKAGGFRTNDSFEEMNDLFPVTQLPGIRRIMHNGFLDSWEFTLNPEARFWLNSQALPTGSVLSDVRAQLWFDLIDGQVIVENVHLSGIGMNGVTVQITNIDDHGNAKFINLAGTSLHFHYAGELEFALGGFYELPHAAFMHRPARNPSYSDYRLVALAEPILVELPDYDIWPRPEPKPR
ncbi:hypothetical protein FWH13_02270 [Candidatus Saccharibacteria bacterium]|nr:hypothetical protein [Candidatus Saccharibacteria bacterium]